MGTRDALALLKLGGEAPLTAASLRRAYLRLALRTHPDKNSGDPAAAERFKALGAAHAALLATLQAGEAAAAEASRTAALLEVLMRALRGEPAETVEYTLRQLGEYRPPAAFGVDLTLPFDGRMPPDAAAAEYDDPPPDLAQVFKRAFADEGLDEEGDPLGGYELPHEREV
ncbi:dnaJ-like protein subfamily C member 5G [Micractinium conductrix]|uniref:DnaJ-like protein subfamily C member 5G n=1 Tax=Micractinium conductrix TaxID=554055 RepID=A0A2P6VP79_9CHLO|nr:dnaJ-like protein subfamily C member 5G [Micractinium conductrix]|eukprot:PSC75901.1 dnaJ-like protein subfamily C member 5G [Micractinium conductrix]